MDINTIYSLIKESKARQVKNKEKAFTPGITTLLIGMIYCISALVDAFIALPPLLFPILLSVAAPFAAWYIYYIAIHELEDHRQNKLQSQLKS